MYHNIFLFQFLRCCYWISHMFFELYRTKSYSSFMKGISLSNCFSLIETFKWYVIIFHYRLCLSFKSFAIILSWSLSLLSLALINLSNRSAIFAQSSTKLVRSFKLPSDLRDDILQIRNHTRNAVIRLKTIRTINHVSIVTISYR